MSRAHARSAACRWPSGRRGEKRRCPKGSRPASQLAPFRVEQAGIKTAEVGYAPLAQTLTTVGYVAFDERRMANIASKVPGKSRVEKLYVNFNGRGRRGRPAAGRTLQPRAEPGDPGTARRDPASATPRVAAADRRGRARCWAIGERWSALSAEKLKRWGISQAQIDEILAKGRTDFTVPILSPVGGHVVQEERRRGPGGAGGLPDVRDRRPRTPSGSRPRSTSINCGLVHEGPGGRGDASRRSRARRSRARSSSSSRTSTRRPARSRSGTPWTTPAIGSGPGCSPR